MAKPFLLRSEKIKTSPEEFARREEILTTMNESEISQVAGGTNENFTINPTWDNGSDHETSNKDFGQ